MDIHVLESAKQKTIERTDNTIFEGGSVWGASLTENHTNDNNVGLVHFAPGARAGWHTHSHDQILYIVSGIGKVGDRTGEQIVSAGDTIVVPANIEHWHGAHDTGAPMSHLSITSLDSETTVLEN